MNKPPRPGERGGFSFDSLHRDVNAVSDWRVRHDMVGTGKDNDELVLARSESFDKSIFTRTCAEVNVVIVAWHRLSRRGRIVIHNNVEMSLPGG